MEEIRTELKQTMDKLADLIKDIKYGDEEYFVMTEYNEIVYFFKEI